MIKLIGILLLCSFWGCSDLYYYDEVKVEIEQVLEREVVSDILFITSVEVQEVISFKITGVERVNILGEVYSEQVKSSWKFWHCRDHGPEQITSCRWKKRSGTCHAYYQDFLEYRKSPIGFFQREKWPFKVMIGGTSYPLDKEFNFDGSALYAKITVTKEMVANGHDLKMAVIQQESKIARTGFLRFGKCEGRGERDFAANALQEFQEMDGQTFRELEISASKEVKR